MQHTPKVQLPVTSSSMFASHGSSPVRILKSLKHRCSSLASGQKRLQASPGCLTLNFEVASKRCGRNVRMPCDASTSQLAPLTHFIDLLSAATSRRVSFRPRSSGMQLVRINIQDDCSLNSATRLSCTSECMGLRV